MTDGNSMLRFLNSTFSKFGPSAESNNNNADKAAGKQTRNPEPRQGKLSRKNLNAFGTNLNEKAFSGEIDCVIGRDKEIERVIQILNRRTKNNPVLLGEPGVGKTAIAEGLALRIVDKQVPLASGKNISSGPGSVVAGTQFKASSKPG